MNQFFVKNEKVALNLDPKAEKHIKEYWMCCCLCDDSPVETQEGWVVKTPLTRAELQKRGILVSSVGDRSISDRN